jgi:hypothetical protein
MMMVTMEERILEKTQRNGHKNHKRSSAKDHEERAADQYHTAEETCGGSFAATLYLIWIIFFL